MRDIGGQDASHPGTIPPTVECACGHHNMQHHRTDTGRTTYCTVLRCGCDKFEENP